MSRIKPDPDQQWSYYDPTWLLDVPVGLELKPHPCPFPDYALDIFQYIIDNLMDAKDPAIVDTMAGLGKIHDLIHCRTFSNELEPEWGYSHPLTTIGDARNTHYEDEEFDGVFISIPYGNRLADKYEPGPKDRSGRKSYRISLGREATDGSSSEKQWGKEFQDLTIGVVLEAQRILRKSNPDRQGGLLAFNVKGHYRKGQFVDVADWCNTLIEGLGFRYVWGVDLDEKGWTFGPEKSRKRDTEKIYVYEKIL